MKVPTDLKTAEYGSHWRVVRQMFLKFDIKRVLETGSGFYSTPLFLEQDIDRLVSIENDARWGMAPQEERHELLMVKGRVADHLPALSDFDLVFIDDDPVKDREATIRAVLEQPHPLVVIHDTDHPPYGNLLNGHGHQTFTQRKPWTSVVWATC